MTLARESEPAHAESAGQSDGSHFNQASLTGQAQLSAAALALTCKQGDALLCLGTPDSLFPQ